MKFSLDFLKEFVDIRISPEKLANKLTMAGLEVSSVKKIGQDFSFEAEVTSNRQDLLSILGIAHEAAALLGKKVNPVKVRPKKKTIDTDIVIKNRDDCRFYAGAVIRNVTVGESPEWLKQRLLSCGMNPVNNIVDITNYCMLKWGQPLHAFDLGRIGKKIIVRRAEKKEKLACLDAKERILDSKILVIADEASVLALAGIIGGENSQVTNHTKNIFLESAVFSPLTIRRGRRQLGVDTESSYRFERSVNPAFTEQASMEAARLICELTGADFAGYKKRGSRPKIKKKPIIFTNKRMEHCLGVRITERQSLKILRSLGCKVNKRVKKTLIMPPVFRQDLNIEEDLYEEISRIYGFDKIEPDLPPLKRHIQKIKSAHDFKKKLRQKLLRLRFSEIMTLSIVSQGHPLLAQNGDFIKIENPLRAGENVLRPEIFMGMVEVMQHNARRKQAGLAFFEIADSFKRDKDSFIETPKLCIGRHSENKEDFFVFKGKIETFLKEVGIKKYSFKESGDPLFSNICELDDFGWIGILHSKVAGKFDLDKVFLAEIDIAKIYKLSRPPWFKKINDYPWIERDISIAVSKDIKFGAIDKMIKQQCGELLKEYKIIDVYKGEKIPDNFSGYTLRVYYQHPERTLESEEVDNLHFGLRDFLEREDGVVLR